MILYPNKELQKIWLQISKEEHINELPAQLTASILKEIKKKYFASTTITTTAVFFGQLSKILSTRIAELNADQLKNLNLSTVFESIIEQINKSCSSNPRLPTLEQIFNSVFAKFEQNNFQINNEINSDLNNIALILKDTIQIIIDEKEKIESKVVARTSFTKQN